MDFQTHQDEAKQGTAKLIALLGLGVLAIMALVTALITFLLAATTSEVDPLAAIAIAAPVTLLGVGGSSAAKSSQLKGGGGSYVATSMGGRSVDFNTLDPAEKQLSNIVEEIAIASGLPVPSVFVLDNEPGINAFAAGWTADNAAIGVTRGALQHLTRDELQGVIAHEFAHIRNGDTKIKTRIIGWVFGIAVLTVLGRILLEALWYAPRRSRNRDKEEMGIVMAMTIAAFALIAIGWVGTLFARAIQASVSRQRELLADASAVQFTRNPDGLAEALSKIGGMSGDNKIRSAHSVEAGHLFISSKSTSVFATHPPLKDRITRLRPAWDGNFRTPEPQVASPAQAPNSANAAGWGTKSGQQMLPGQTIPGMPQNKALPFDPAILFGGILAAEGANQQGSATGDAPPPGPASDPQTANDPGAAGAQSFQPPNLDGPTDDHINYARELLDRIPDTTRNYLHTRGGAVAAVFGLLASTDPAQRQQDLRFAADATGLDVDYINDASDVISRLDRALQLPAIDIALHSIRETPWNFQETLRETVLSIESSRPDQDLFRWILRRVLIRHLEDQHDTGSSKHNVPFEQLQDYAVTVYTAIAWFNSSGAEWAPTAFSAALAETGISYQPIPPETSLSVEKVDEALEKLSHLDVPSRKRFVMGAMAIVDQDSTTTADEAELIRVVADAVRLPVPPLLPV